MSGRLKIDDLPTEFCDAAFLEFSNEKLGCENRLDNMIPDESPGWSPPWLLDNLFETMWLRLWSVLLSNEALHIYTTIE